ncbi:antibiotic biosynthesis monooxygenase [Alloscardovia macacae]|uniref:Antibiotic biosynthesis monooxygenase n=1 Tax=Alloscardovia macacae TaxID=1160091 RepID=A0A1Y2T0S8_9BIFI|nr:putative quinol monooxygenase [Alloscardovia macacae]OTA27583.1 antibiotic biosynthesis monooxygenase [Alloscardovia macacae]OTA30229.1 antibiotic biosynthesis monooxygenase [Alloscardovia macacae]
MSLTVNLHYAGAHGSARAFVEEMESSGIAAANRAEEGNERYDYYQSLADPETVLLIDQWRDQESLDVHHASPMMAQLAELREKYDLHIHVDRFTPLDMPEDHDAQFLRR